jgi:hypothetical protein
MPSVFAGIGARRFEIMKTLVAVVLALSLLSASPSAALAQASTTNTVLMTAGDIILMRPFSFAATVVGFTLFVVGYPIIAITGNQTAWDDLVMKPARATFTRCLGCDMVDEAPEEGSASS